MNSGSAVKRRVKDGQSRDAVTREMRELRFEPSVTEHNSGIQKEAQGKLLYTETRYKYKSN